ncbi:hypothetical protein OSB04_019565 [Centaurea solstitialis]|uniref:CCHC-type domain-containing protein n=1 Tax=Centaurea solstitialis TaxID=347529 RepID=A0AA38W557_9ASTR|nr:hypothetical protein OSB04_019565 [Centaurea solstitialis]
MVTTRRNQGSGGSETPDLMDLIGSEVNEVLHQLLPGLFAQMKDELLQAFDERIEAAFIARGSGTGSTSQSQGRTSTFKDFMACQPPHFEGRKDPIACFRWVAAVEGAFRTSGCPEGMKVLLDEQLAPRIEKERITAEFLNLKQTTESVNKITDQFLEKSLFCPDYVSTDAMKMFRYRGVLKTDPRVPRTRELFLEEQQQGKRKAEQEPVPGKKLKGQRSDGSKGYPGCSKCGKNHSGECRLPEPVCFKCGKPGHRSRECRVEPRTCFRCFQPGHIKPNCPQLVGAAAAATPAPTPLMITDGATGKESGSTTGGRGRVFQLTAGEAEADPDMVAGGLAPELYREVGCGVRTEGSVAASEGFRVDPGTGRESAREVSRTFLGLISGTKSCASSLNVSLTPLVVYPFPGASVSKDKGKAPA